MKKTLKNFIAVVLCVLMLMPLSFAFTASNEIIIEKNVPQVNVVGLFGTTVYEDTDDVKSDTRWPISDGRFLDLIKNEKDFLIESKA